MNDMANQIAVQIGDTVYSADDHKLGIVKAFDTRFITVEHGLLSKSEYFIPFSAVNATGSGSVYLNVAKGDVGGQGWDAPPLIETDAGDLLRR